MHPQDTLASIPSSPLDPDILLTGHHRDADRALRLPACLDLLAAESLHQNLRERMEDNCSFVIDGSDVERVSTSCLQLLVAAMLSAHSRQLSVAVVKPSQVLADAIQDLDLCRTLGMEISR